MTAAFQCPQSNWGCFENQILGAFSIFSSFIFVVALKKIQKDRNNILDRIDKFIFILGTVQIVACALYFTILSNTFALATVRVARLVGELVICMVFLYTIIEKEKQNFYYKLMQIGIFLSFCLWFYSAILHQDTISYKCLVADFLILSTLTLGITAITFTIGCMTIYINNEFSRDKNINEESQGQNKIAHDEYQKIKLQLQIFMFGGFGSSLVQFLWDYIAYMNSYTIQDCMNYYDSSSFFSLIFYVVLKAITLLLPPYIMYYIYYYRNRNFLQNNTDNGQDRNLKVFYDNRSDLIEEMELDDEPEQKYQEHHQAQDHFPHPVVPHMSEEQYYYEKKVKDGEILPPEDDDEEEEFGNLQNGYDYANQMMAQQYTPPRF